jgi:hypothetical protein
VCKRGPRKSAFLLREAAKLFGNIGVCKDYLGGRSMSAHDSEHAHHEPEDESVGFKVGIFFILVLVALDFIAL